MGDEESAESKEEMTMEDVTTVVDQQPSWLSWFSGSAYEASLCAGQGGLESDTDDLEMARPELKRSKSSRRQADLRGKQQKNRRMSLTNVKGLSTHFANGKLLMPRSIEEYPLLNNSSARLTIVLLRSLSCRSRGRETLAQRILVRRL